MDDKNKMKRPTLRDVPGEFNFDDSAPAVQQAPAERWSCFTCGYRGDDADYSTTEEGACPKCGTQSGDGFGMAENETRRAPKAAQQAPVRSPGRPKVLN